MAIHLNSQGETRNTRDKYLAFLRCLSSQTARLRPGVCKIGHIKLSVKLSIAVLETNCTTPNETDNHPIEWREEAAQRPVTYLPFCLLGPLLVFLCVCVCVCLCVSVWTAGGREMMRQDRRWAIIVWKVFNYVGLSGKKKLWEYILCFLPFSMSFSILFSPKPGFFVFLWKQHGNAIGAVAAIERTEVRRGFRYIYSFLFS